jgi:hypothetical protein
MLTPQQLAKRARLRPRATKVQQKEGLFGGLNRVLGGSADGNLPAKQRILYKGFKDEVRENSVRGDNLDGKSHGTFFEQPAASSELTIATSPRASEEALYLRSDEYPVGVT